MTALTARLVAMFEECGMTPEEIAEDHGLEVSVVKAGLLANSKIFRAKYNENKRSGSETPNKEADVTEDELQEFIEMYKHLARTTEDENLKERTLRNLINEGKGRNDIVNVAKNSPTVNIVVLNNALEQARKRIAESRQMPRELPRVVDIETAA